MTDSADQFSYPNEPRPPRLDPDVTRRTLLQRTLGGGAVLGLVGAGLAHPALADDSEPVGVRKGRLKQSLCHWCMGMSVEALAEVAVRLSIPSVELLTASQFGTIQKLGLTCAMTQLDGENVIGNGLNRPENHERYLGIMRQAIDDTAAAGFPNVICFSGNRNGLDDDTGLENCAAGLKKIVGHAEKSGVTLCMELLNSKEHKDYMCDRTEWGVKLVNLVGSERFKLLYDVYHMQRVEGDVIATIRKHKDVIGHYHTAGNPGRSDLDKSQELQYPAICRAIVETGYTGYLGQEFYPKAGEASIRQAVELCDV